ncbi:MAG: hypothetical protein GDA49_03995, partial [Rhodospirillales bacterium]|nr:hypothetical protein [Rhodospirillales bacterium]
MNKLSSVVAAVLLIAGVAAHADSGEATILASAPGATGQQGPEPLVVPHYAGFRNATIQTSTYNKQASKLASISNAVFLGPALSNPSSLRSAGKGLLTGYLRTEFYGSSRIMGRLAVTADFSDGRVTTFASNFRRFDTADDPSPSGGWNSRGRVLGTLSGSGTITTTAFASTLDGRINDGVNGDIDVDADMQGEVFAGRGKKLTVYGTSITGTYTIAASNNLRGSGTASSRQTVTITDPGSTTPTDINGDFYLSDDKNGQRIALRLNPGGSGVTIRPLRHLRETDNMNFIAAAAETGLLEAPDSLPAGSGTLSGYVRADNLYNNRRLIGSLTINADFDAGTVSARAQDFSD